MVSAAGLLEQAMDDGDAALVLADWLEERGDEARARLLRRHLEHERNPEARERLVAETAGDASVLGREVAPLLKEIPLLQVGAALLPFLVADAAESDATLAEGSEWQGNLWQVGRTVPTRLALRRRTGNRIVGDMREDFAHLYGGLVQAHGTFHFAGVAVGRVLAFVTHRVEGDGVQPGLYLLRLGGGGWLSGTWRVPSWSMRGAMRLRRVAAR